MFAKVENGMTKSKMKIVPKFPRKNKQKKSQFWPGIFHFFEQDRLLFARVEIGVTEFPTKKAKEEQQEEEKTCVRFLSKVVGIP